MGLAWGRGRRPGHPVPGLRAAAAPRPSRSSLGVEWWPSYAHAVVHRDGVFLFDNGAGIGNAEVESTFTPRVRPIEGALEAVGISLADVTGAANCHLHFDHSGQNARLHRACRSSSSAPSGRRCTNRTTRWPSGSTSPGWPTSCSTARPRSRPGSGWSRRPGTPPGHQSLVIDDPGRHRSCWPARRVRSRAEWDGSTATTDSGRPDAADGEIYDASVARLRSLAPARVHFAHDDADLGTLRRRSRRERRRWMPSVRPPRRAVVLLAEGGRVHARAARPPGGRARDAGGRDDRSRRPLRRRAVRAGVRARGGAADPRGLPLGAGRHAAAG